MNNFVHLNWIAGKRRMNLKKVVMSRLWSVIPYLSSLQRGSGVSSFHSDASSLISRPLAALVKPHVRTSTPTDLSIFWTEVFGPERSVGRSCRRLYPCLLAPSLSTVAPGCCLSPAHGLSPFNAGVATLHNGGGRGRTWPFHLLGSLQRRTHGMTPAWHT